MTNFRLIFIAAYVFLFGENLAYGQGCSDAGFCTMNSFKPNSTDSNKVFNNRFKLGAFYGKADNAILVFGSYLEYNRQVNSRIGFDVKLTSIAQNGNGISTFGLSDIFLNANYKVGTKAKLTLGTKIPLSNANKTYNNLPLPMDYQASLGTLDLIFGIGYEIRKFQFVAAIQHPLTQNNNQFIASNYPNVSELRSFSSTNKFRRSSDVLLRVSYPLNINQKLKITPSILPIYHLAKDKYVNEFDVLQDINGSQGLTLNANAYLDYKINSKNLIQLNIGMPFIVRDTRPDGLTRSLIANMEYQFNF